MVLMRPAQLALVPALVLAQAQAHVVVSVLVLLLTLVLVLALALVRVLVTDVHQCCSIVHAAKNGLLSELAPPPAW
jgi:hypothetical protein